MHGYRIALTPDGATFLAACPALPELTTFGDTKREAMAHARDATTADVLKDFGR